LAITFESETLEVQSKLCIKACLHGKRESKIGSWRWRPGLRKPKRTFVMTSSTYKKSKSSKRIFNRIYNSFRVFIVF